MEDNIFDKIFALRISLMDIYYDEKSIIYNIKKNLNKYDNIENEEELNQIIIDFYKKYDIDITTIDLNSLNVINHNPESDFEDLLNIINSTFIPLVGNNANFLENENILSEDVNNSTEDVNNSTEDVNNSTEDVNNSTVDLENDLIVNNSENSIIESESLNDFDSLSADYNNSNTFINTSNLNNISSEQFLNVINIFNDILNSNINNNDTELEDVIVTLDDNDYDKLEIIKYKELDNSLENKCSVCLVEFQDDDNVMILPCKHYYHTNCIKEWLKEYDYKCPVCRYECGKTKNNIL